MKIQNNYKSTNIKHINPAYILQNFQDTRYKLQDTNNFQISNINFQVPVFLRFCS